MRQVLPLVGAAALLLSCGETSLAPFAQLQAPVALAVHRPSANVFIASLGGDELRVFDAIDESFLTAPAALFPLSIPTVSKPTRLAAADRFVFVLSGPDAELGFVDTVVPSGAAGPRSVNVGGFPLTLPLDMVPSDLEAFSASWAWGPDGQLADHVLVAGIDGDGLGGVLLAIRPPMVDGTEISQLPVPEAVLELPDIYPTSIAIDPTPAPLAGLRGPDGARVIDCRPLAIADGRHAPAVGHEPGIWMTRVRVEPDGALSIDPLDPADRIEIRVTVVLADGTSEERVAPVRDVAFAPAPLTDSALAALAIDPCAPRSGRLYAVLDPAHCAGTTACADVAIIDLAGPDGPGLATDAIEGGPALYDFPATILSVTALPGPFNLPGAFAPAAFLEDGTNARLDQLPALGLLASTNGSIYYLAGGLGPYLVGPDPATRATGESVFPVDAQQEGAGISTALVRTDAGIRGSELSTPAVVIPGDARPRDERWDIAYLVPLPGLAELGRASGIDADGNLQAPAGVDFLVPVAVQASADPRAADRVVPVTFAGALCEGFPIVSVSSDSVELDLGALANDETCLEPTLPLVILPPLDAPWWVLGQATGFSGRLPGTTGEDRPVSRVFAGSDLQFAFTPPEETPPERATFRFFTTDGFQYYAAPGGDFGELPAAVAPFLASGPQTRQDADWRVFIAYSGTDSLARLRPTEPDNMSFLQ